MKPQKKIPETDAIFAQVAKANKAADADATVLRLSLDSKAKVKIGNLSRRGKARAIEAPQADDHDELGCCVSPFWHIGCVQLWIYFRPKPALPANN